MPSRTARTTSNSPNHHQNDELDPERAWRKPRYLQLCKVEWALEDLETRAMFDDAQFEALGFRRGAPLDVDDEAPLDLDSRFFRPLSAADATAALELMTGPTSPYPDSFARWFSPSPLQVPPKNGTFNDVYLYITECYDNAHWIEQWISEVVELISPKWVPHGAFKPQDGPYLNRIWEAANGQFTGHWFFSGNFQMYRTPNQFSRRPDPSIPHAMGRVLESLVPRKGCLLRSELITITNLMKAQIHARKAWPRHRVFPVLVVSYHGRFSARIIQAHWEDGHIIMRISRMLNLHTRELPEDAKILIQWLCSQPIGDTQLASPESSLIDEADEGETPDADTFPPNGIPVQG